MFLVMSRAEREVETHRKKVCLICDMEIPSLRVKEHFLNTLISISVSLRRVSVREAIEVAYSQAQKHLLKHSHSQKDLLISFLQIWH